MVTESSSDVVITNMNDHVEEECHKSGPNRAQSGTNVQNLVLRHIASIVEQKWYLIYADCYYDKV